MACRPVSTASAGIHTGSGNAGWRAAPEAPGRSWMPIPVRTSWRIMRTGCGRAKDGVPPAAIEGHLSVIGGGNGGRAGVVSCARRASSAGRTDQSANPVHLGGRTTGWTGSSRGDRRVHRGAMPVRRSGRCSPLHAGAAFDSRTAHAVEWARALPCGFRPAPILTKKDLQTSSAKRGPDATCRHIRSRDADDFIPTNRAALVPSPHRR